MIHPRSIIPRWCSPYQAIPEQCTQDKPRTVDTTPDKDRSVHTTPDKLRVVQTYHKSPGQYKPHQSRMGNNTTEKPIAVVTRKKNRTGYDTTYQTSPGRCKSHLTNPGRCTAYKTRLVWCIPYHIIRGLCKSFQSSPGWCTPIYLRMIHTNKPNMVHTIPSQNQDGLHHTRQARKSVQHAEPVQDGAHHTRPCPGQTRLHTSPGPGPDRSISDLSICSTHCRFREQDILLWNLTTTIFPLYSSE